jgi:hypothetical protein
MMVDPGEKKDRLADAFSAAERVARSEILEAGRLVGALRRDIRLVVQSKSLGFIDTTAKILQDAGIDGPQSYALADEIWSANKKLWLEQQEVGHA